MVAGARFCDAVIGRPLETAHRQVAAWGRRDGVPSCDFERRAPKNLETTPWQDDQACGSPLLTERGGLWVRPLTAPGATQSNQLGRDPRQRALFALSKTVLDADVLPLDPAEFLQSPRTTVVRGPPGKRKPMRRTVEAGCCARATSGHVAAAPPQKRDELAASQLVELRSVPRQPDCRISNWRGSVRR